MSAREVVLDGGSPWGFRMHGGVDVQQPLRISRVNPGSKAALKGIREGDIITSINNQPTKDISNADAHILLKKSGDALRLGLNEDCKSSPKRRQYKTLHQETHSESIERSNTTKTSVLKTSVTIHRRNSEANDNETPKEEILKITGGREPENSGSAKGISQVSTSSSSPSTSSLRTEPGGIGIETRQEARDSAARNLATKTTTIPVAEQNSDCEMGGSSRSHKKRSRANRRKKTTDATPPSAEVAENKVLRDAAAAAPNYRVESPETTEKPKTIVKSKSLENDDLKITELSEVGEGDEKNETDALVTEAESDVEWEETEDLQEVSVSNIEITEEAPLFDPEVVQVSLASSESDENLRGLLESIEVGPGKKEGYKERKARKRAAIAEHFMPVLENPRYLDVISEEDAGEKVMVIGKTTAEALGVQGTCAMSLVQTKTPEVVFLDEDEEEEEEEQDQDQDQEKNENEDVEKQDPCNSLNDAELLPLTPPPTPELKTPIYENMEFHQEELFKEEFKGFCENLNINEPSASPIGSRASSTTSEASSKCTALYNPMASSLTDVLMLTEPESLKEICLQKLLVLPWGPDAIEELAEVSKNIQELTEPQNTNPLFKIAAVDFGGVGQRREAQPDLTESRLLAILRDCGEFPSVNKPSKFSDSVHLDRKKCVSHANLDAMRNSEGARSPRRRFSLPQDMYQEQLQYIQGKEREIQKEIEELEMERRRLMSEFDVEKYRISKQGDIAIRDEREEAQIPMAPTEFFRQKMYKEYMGQIAAREDRKLNKVIKITSSVRNSLNLEEAENLGTCEVTHVSGIEDEFMDKVKERMRKFGLKRDESEEKKGDPTPEREDGSEPVLVMDRDSLKNTKGLPKHILEFVEITKRAADVEDSTLNSDSGIWSPGQKPSEELQTSQEPKSKDEPIAPVWTPKSAGSSPIAERKEFRPVNFESPVLERKNKPKTEDLQPQGKIPTPPPWQGLPGSNQLGSKLSSTLERRIPTSRSAPASGFTEFSAPRLPRAQNPTITLLQKAREGQLPRGAAYLQSESKIKYERSPIVNREDSVYQIRTECSSDNERDRRKMTETATKKFEAGIGPIAQDGTPLVLRSEVKEANQSRWYKKMYDTIHKQKPDREFVTIRYKQRRARYPYASGYFSEPEHSAFAADYYDSDGTASDYNKYATLDRRRAQQTKDKGNEYMSSTTPRNKELSNGIDPHKSHPGRIENYVPGRCSISEKEAKEWWDEVMDIFDGHLEQQQKSGPLHGQNRGCYMSQALKESGYESDSTLVFRRREDAVQQLSPSEQREVYKNIQKGGDVPFQGLRKPAPERPRESAPPPPTPPQTSPPPPPPPKGQRNGGEESPRKYVENEVTIHYKTPVRQEVKESLSEEELTRRQAEHMKRVYEEERRRKYLQVSPFSKEVQDMNSRRHTDNFIPSQKSPIPLNRYDDFPLETSPRVKARPRSPECRLVARALYNFVGQSSKELTFRKGDLIYVRRQVDKNWYEGEHNAMIGLFPSNHVEILAYDGSKATVRRSHEGQARAKFNFIAQTHLELSLAKGELVVITRRVDDNWFEGRIGGRKGIFPVSYVEVLIDPTSAPSVPQPPMPEKPVASPAAHSLLLNGSAGGKESMGSHSYTPNYQHFTSSYRAKPAHVIGGTTSYGSLTSSLRNPINEALHIDTHSEPVPYRALYRYRPQNDDELELLEGDVVYVLEKCDDGWYVGSSQRSGAFGTFPGNYVERI